MKEQLEHKLITLDYYLQRAKNNKFGLLDKDFEYMANCRNEIENILVDCMDMHEFLQLTFELFQEFDIQFCRLLEEFIASKKKQPSLEPTYYP
jgi:hypothetical protein